MKKLFPVIILASALVSHASIASQTADKYILASNSITVKATTILSTGDAAKAQGLFERALVANPTNITAMIGLGHAHEAQGRVGKSLKYYRQAIEISPNNVEAIIAQSLGFLKKDFPNLAQKNREKLSRLCVAGCKDLDKLDAATSQYDGKSEVAEAKPQPE